MTLFGSIDFIPALTGLVPLIVVVAVSSWERHF